MNLVILFSSNQGNPELHYIYHTHMTNHTKRPCTSIQFEYRTGQAGTQICEQLYVMGWQCLWFHEQ